MPRPFCRRRVDCLPRCDMFRPGKDAAAAEDEGVTLTLDEFEAVRLSDLLGLYQEEAASRMGVSRATLGRILGQARRKIAEAIVMGREIRISGGSVELTGPGRGGSCAACGSRKACNIRRAGTEGFFKKKESGNMDTKKILIPVLDDNGLESLPAGHFGQAPFFLLVELDGKGETVSLKSVPNKGEHFGGCGHAHDFMAECKPDFLVVYGMGPRGLESFKNAGTRVLKCCEGAVKDVIKAFVAGQLPELEGACEHHCH